MEVPQIPMNLGFPLARAHAMVEKSRIKQALEEVLGPKGYDIENLVKGRGGGTNPLSVSNIFGSGSGSGSGSDSGSDSTEDWKSATSGRSPGGASLDGTGAGDALDAVRYYLDKVMKFVDGEDAENTSFQAATYNLNKALFRLQVIESEFSKYQTKDNNTTLIRQMARAVLNLNEKSFDKLSQRLLSVDNGGDDAHIQQHVSHMRNILEKMKLIDEQTGADGEDTEKLREKLTTCKTDAIRASEIAQKKYEELKYLHDISNKVKEMTLAVIRQDENTFEESVKTLMNTVSNDAKSEFTKFVTDTRDKLKELQAMKANAESGGMDAGLSKKLQECQQTVLEAAVKASKELAAKDAEIATSKAALEAAVGELETAKAEAASAKTQLEAKEAEIVKLVGEKDKAVADGKSSTDEQLGELEKCKTQKNELFKLYEAAVDNVNFLELEVNFHHPRFHSTSEKIKEITDEVNFISFFVSYLEGLSKVSQIIGVVERINKHVRKYAEFEKVQKEYVNNITQLTETFETAHDEAISTKKAIEEEELTRPEIAKRFNAIRDTVVGVHVDLDIILQGDIDVVFQQVVNFKNEVLATMAQLGFEHITPETKFSRSSKKATPAEQDNSVDVPDTGDTGVPSRGGFSATTGTSGAGPIPVSSPGADSGVEESKGSSPQERQEATWSVKDQTYIDQMVGLTTKTRGGRVHTRYPSPDNHALKPFLLKMVENATEYKQVQGRGLDEKRNKKAEQMLKQILNGENVRALFIKDPTSTGFGDNDYFSVNLPETQTHARYRELKKNRAMTQMDKPSRQMRLFLLVVYHEGLISKNGHVYLQPKSSFDLSDLFPWL